MKQDQKKENKGKRRQAARGNNSEACLWILLHNKKVKGNTFYRHFPIGEFFVDFFCPDANLAIIIDNDEFYTDFHLESCCERENYLESAGVNVLHIDNKLILEDSKLVLNKIVSELSASVVCDSLKAKVDMMESLHMN